MYKCMYKSMISTMIIKNINTKRARSAIGGSRASQRERNRSDKKRKTGKKKMQNCVATCPTEDPLPLIFETTSI